MARINADKNISLFPFVFFQSQSLLLPVFCTPSIRLSSFPLRFPIVLILPLFFRFVSGVCFFFSFPPFSLPFCIGLGLRCRPPKIQH